MSVHVVADSGVVPDQVEKLGSLLNEALPHSLQPSMGRLY